MTFSLFSEKEQPEQAVAVEKHDDLPIMPGESSEDCLGQSRTKKEQPKGRERGIIKR